jgi:hypothetical protein
MSDLLSILNQNPVNVITTLMLLSEWQLYVLDALEVLERLCPNFEHGKSN